MKPINFYSFGIPGFKGTRQEKIVTKKQLILNTIFLPLTGSIPIEPIYKHISGYYKRLERKRELDVEFDIVANLIKFYGIDFFINTYEIDESEIYEFVTATYENFPLRESFKRDKITESRSERNSDINGENVENSNQNSDKDLVETSRDENKSQKSVKSQIEIN